MATARPFAYNIGAPIAGTEQVGGLAVGTPTSGFASTGLPWWNGPDEEEGYVIAQSVPSNTQTTPSINTGQMYWGTAYKATDIDLSNSNTTASQIFSYSQSVLSNTFIQKGQKIMFTVSYSTSQAASAGAVIGIGTTSMNYAGPFNGYPGNDNQSIGFSNDGNFYFNGSILTSSLPTWTTGDTIDVAVDNVNGLIWVRVNGGNWNNNSGDNPATATGGLGVQGLNLKFTYPASNPYIYGSMTIISNAPYGVPAGFTTLGTNVTASVGFFRSSALTDPSFISIANAVAGPSGGGPFASGSAAKTWLNSNGYWTSYVGATGATGGTGAFNVSITQVGGNVVWSGSGSFNFTDLTLAGTGGVTPGFSAGSAIWAMGPTGNYDSYSGVSLTYPTSIGSGAAGVPPTGSGDVVGVLPGGSGRVILVPTGYTSGSSLSSSVTYSGTTIAGLGLTAGTYTWAWGSGANASSLVMVIGGTGSTGSTGATGAGWLFYAPEGPVVDPPPTSDGQAIFTDSTDSGVVVTYNPNKSAGVNFLNFNLQDSSGVDYTTQFTTLQNSGGTISVSQGSNTATYVLGVGGAFINVGLGFVAINASTATQTVNASSSFVFGTPITIAFS